MSLEPYPQHAVAAILDAFARHPLVALGEVHALQEEADFIASLLHHPAFPQTVNDIVVEVGNALYQDVIDRFIAGEPVPNPELRPVWRDIVGSPYGLGDAPIYEQFFRTVRAINRTLPPSQRLRVLLGDPPLDWKHGQSRKDIEPVLAQRDTHYANVVEQEVLAKGRKALLIAGTLHLLRKPVFGDEQPNLVQIIEGRHPGAIFIVIPHKGFGSRNAELEPNLHSWSIPALAALEDTWLGALSPGLLFGEGLMSIDSDGHLTPVNPYEGAESQSLQELGDAYLYVGARASLTVSCPNPAIYLGDTQYLAEIQRRHVLLWYGKALDTEDLLSEYGPRYFPD